MKSRNLKRMSWMFGFCVWMALGERAIGSRFSTEIYSEQGYLTQEDTLISSLRVRELMPVAVNIKPFLQLGNEGTSFLYFGPGLSWQFLNLTTLFEWRERSFYKNLNQEPNRDLRASVLFNQQWFSELSKNWSSYQEVYTEAVLTSADDNNTVLSGWVRSGVRQVRLSPFVFDLFLEPFASTDTLGRAYNRKIELRPSLRAQYSFSKLYLGLIGAYVIPVSGKMESQGQWVKRESGVRVLAVLGGEV